MTFRVGFIVLVCHCISTIRLADAQWSNPIKSVISGTGTFFARQLPKPLTSPFGPDPTHPNLRFWFTPDSFEQDNVADNTPVETWRNVAQLGVINGAQTLYGDPEQPERLMQTTASQQPLYKRGIVNGHGVVRFTRSNTDGSQGKRLLMYKNSSSIEKGFSMNPFSDSFTMMMVVKTKQDPADTGEMGIFSAGETGDAVTGEKGLHIFKTCSTCTLNGGIPPKCFQGKYASLSTLNALYGQSSETLTGNEEAMKNCVSECSSGCDLNNIPPSCSSQWGPNGHNNLQDPDQMFRILTIRVTKSNSQATLQVYIDGLHASTQPPINVSEVTPPSIVQFMLGVKAFNNDTNLQYMSGDIAEILIYNVSLTNLEADRLGHYLSKKYAIPYFRLDAEIVSATRSVPLSCSNCAGTGPIGEAGQIADGGVTEDYCYEAQGTIDFVQSTKIFNISTTKSLRDNCFKNLYIRICQAGCQADPDTGVISNLRGTSKIVSNSMSMLTLETAISDIASGDAVIIANAHKVKLAGVTNMYGIKAADEDDYYSYKRAMNIFFQDGRCEGKAARILSYNATSRCATIGGDLEVGDFDLQSVATLKDQWGFCSGTGCQGPNVGGIGGAGEGHISSIKIRSKATSGCTAGMSITASSSTGSDFYAEIDAAANGQIESIQIISHGNGYVTAPSLMVSDPACLCDSLSWENSSTAANSGACLEAIIGSFPDQLPNTAPTCVPEPGRRYLIARDFKYSNIRTSGYYYGANYISGGAFQEGPAAGGSFVRIRGAYLFPNDMHINGVASVTNIQLMNGQDATTNLKYLQVNIGGNVADGCTLYNFPRGNDPAGTRSLTVYDYSAVDELPEIRCKVPSGVGHGNDLQVSWHGVAVTISNWFKYSKPIVRTVSPVAVSFSGGDKITVYGNNFGPQAAWATGSMHPGRIELYNRGYQSCVKVEYVSDSELRCIVPALRPVNLNFDKSTRTLSVKVVVNVGGQASALDTAPILTYQKVPTYYSCAIAANDVCMSCCRGACMLDAIADSPSSSISSSCDSTCYRFCGILSSSRRLLEVLRQIMETRNSTRR